MSDMPDVIYVLEGKHDSYDGVWDKYQWSDQCGAKYIRAYLRDRRVTELLEANNRLVEEIRKLKNDPQAATAER